MRTHVRAKTRTLKNRHAKKHTLKKHTYTYIDLLGLTIFPANPLSIFPQVVFGLLVICWALLILVWSGCKLDIFPDCVGLWKPKILSVEINQYGVFYKGE